MRRCTIGILLAVVASLLIAIPVLAVTSVITNFVGIPTNIQVSLSWTKGVGGTTVIRRSTTAYPATALVDTPVYSGTNNSCLDTGLTAGSLYYYSGFDFDGGAYAAAVHLLVATDATAMSWGDALPTKNVDASFTQDPDATKFSTFEPLYTWGNVFFNGWGIDPDRGWEGLFMVLVAVLAIGAYAWVHNFEFAYVVMCIGLGTLARIGIMPGWITYAAIVIGLGAFGLERNLKGD